MKQEMTGWQWHQLDHMQIICTLLLAITSPLNFLQADALLDAQRTVSKHWQHSLKHRKSMHTINAASLS